MISVNYAEKGLTLLEILVVLAIIGIVAAISVPNMSGWTSSRTINNDLGELTKLIDYAKVNSVKKKKKFLLVNDNNNKSLSLYQSKNVDTSTTHTPTRSRWLKLDGLSRGDERALLRGCSRSVRTGPVTSYTTQPGWPGRGVGE